MVTTFCGAALLLTSSAQGQLVTKLDAIPRTGKPPVVFLNGFQTNCSNTSFRGTFGTADQLVQQDGRASIFFDNCAVNPGHPPIEELGSKFAEFLASLRYEDGAAVTQVDIVAHSMGGLIVRSYLSGKQTADGVFNPPAETKVRKAIFLGTPHFGTKLTVLLNVTGGTDQQVSQMQVGSAFTFDLATWNQGIDDLRGVDAIAVLGNAGNDLSGLFGIPNRTRGFDDGVTSLTSGSLGFFGANRTRIIPYCHTDIANLLCTNTRNLASIDSNEHLAGRIIVSFLNDTQDWRNIGETAEQNTFLSKNGGLYLRYRSSSDAAVEPQSMTATGVSLAKLGTVVYSDFVSAPQDLNVQLGLPSGQTAITVPITPGSTRAFNVKQGPSISAIVPSAAALFPRTLAPGMLISVYGTQLTGSSGEAEVTIAGQRVPVSFARADQLNTMVPEDASGFVKAQVRNSTGEQTLNVLVEPSAPALFAPALNAVTGVLVSQQAPIRPGEYVALFLTGLGRTTPRDGLNWAAIQPEVTIGGRPCAVTFTGRAPGFPGLDQINCQIAADVPPSDATPVVVRSGSRSSNVTTLPVR